MDANATGYEYFEYDAENRLVRAVNVTGKGGRLIGCWGCVGQVTPTDRLGSVGGLSKYYPYGQERQLTYQDTEKFATYYRDATGLDYAWNRYYSPTWGRFLQADPYVSPDALKNPQGWNRYAYVVGDPVNYYDPAGLFISVPSPFPPLPPVINVTTAPPFGGGGSAADLFQVEEGTEGFPGEVGGGGGGPAAVGYKIEVVELSKSAASRR